MAPNVPALRAYLARLENGLSIAACDACDAVTPSRSSTYQRGAVGTLVTPPAARNSNFAEIVERATDATVDLDEREAMALAGEVPLAFARVFAAMQVARPASVDEPRWRQAINDAGVFVDTWGGVAERLGWTARDIFGPHFTPSALAWALQGAQVIALTATEAHLSDGRTFARSFRNVISAMSLEPLGA